MRDTPGLQTVLRCYPPAPLTSMNLESLLDWFGIPFDSVRMKNAPQRKIRYRNHQRQRFSFLLWISRKFLFWCNTERLFAQNAQIGKPAISLKQRAFILLREPETTEN